MKNYPNNARVSGSILELRGQLTMALADPGGAAVHAPPPPQQDQFLSFSHTFLPKSVCIGGWRPPPPQREILDPPLYGIAPRSSFHCLSADHTYFVCFNWLLLQAIEFMLNLWQEATTPHVLCTNIAAGTTMDSPDT